MKLKARLYIAAVILAGVAAVWAAAVLWHSQDLMRLAVFLITSVLASGLKVTLPGITGTMSVNFFFILLGIVELSPGEAVLIGSASVAIQCLWRTRVKPKAIQVAFNLSACAVATIGACATYAGLMRVMDNKGPLLMMIAASAYFVMNTLSIAAVVGLTEQNKIRKIWYECYFWCFPYYLIGGALAWVISLWDRSLQWQTSVVIMPSLYFIYRSYRLYLGRLEDEKKHVEEMSNLHLRTIESLALAIEAKDFTAHDHLQRVRVYAIELGNELGLEKQDMEALRAAALLHDIGKLAVPEHIISKPGKLTPEEFEKMKIHPVVGAEILERVQFPYPVAPIVRAHHECWDGSGYPDGLAGEQIPMGARILAAVDCLDALASDRQYRRALELDEAMEFVKAESGKSFDPRVVEVLARRYKELEPLAQAQAQDKAKLSRDVKITKGAPAAGFVSPDFLPISATLPALSSIAAARQEAQMLFELTQDLGTSLSIDETLSVVAARLKRMVPYDAIAIYVRRGTSLAPIYVNGEDRAFFSGLEIPIGQGLSGWVAGNRQPMISGSPVIEESTTGPIRTTKLKSALSVPLEGLNGVVGALTLYKAEEQGFTRDHLRILLAISSKTSFAIENALRYRQAEDSATTDYLTNLPNARSLFLRLDSELARCRRESLALAVVVGDLNGFKQLNDRFGHLEGNRVLRLVAEALQGSCRQYDYVARMGGDEFVMIFPGLRAAALDETVSRLDRAVSTVARDACGADWVSMSMGAAVYPDDGSDAEQLLAEADRRMYKFKQTLKLAMQKGPAPVIVQRLEPLVIN